jgi:glycosyltransferase involved in cell wall biosynthesis
VFSLSICIICKNEVDRIAACLDAVAGLSEDIIVVDSGSNDGTQEIARAHGGRVVFNAWTGYGPQKRFSEEQAVNDWILNLDADEVVTADLKTEIARALECPAFVAYRLRIMTIYPGHQKPRAWADYNNYVRLYDRRCVRFRDSAVHDTVNTGTFDVGQLQGSVFHYSARSYAHIRQKLSSYTDLQAKTLVKPRWLIAGRLPFEYPLVFLKYLLGRRHFTGGMDGIVSAHLAAEARFMRLIKMWHAH